MKIHLVPFPLALIPLALISPAWAQDYFDGGTNGTATAWGTASNWLGDSTPGPADDVVLDALHLNGGKTSLPDLTLGGTSNREANSITLDLAQDWTLTANNSTSETANGATLTLTSGAMTRTAASSGIHLFGTPAANGAVTTLATSAGGFTISNQGASGSLNLHASLSGSDKTVSISGPGTTLFSGSNSYTGATTVGGGTLLINGDQSAATGTTTIQSGASLGGTGIIGGDLILEAAAIHAPGSSPGIQTINGDLSYADQSIFSWDLNSLVADSSARGTEFDGVNGSGGSFDVLDGAIFRILLGETFDAVEWQAASEQSWSIFEGFGLGESTGTFNDFELFDTSGGTAISFTDTGSFSFAYDSGGNGVLTWSAVPEPSSALAGLLLGAGLLRRRRA